MSMLRTGVRYAANLTSMVARQEGMLTAAVVGTQFVATEAAKFPRAAKLKLQPRSSVAHPPLMSDQILADLRGLGVDMQPYHIDVAGFREHVARFGYSSIYAAGNLDEGGNREEKLLEYFVSLALLQPHTDDVMIDVASEWSIFPEVARRATGATVFQQDLIYPPGIKGFRIGGSAADMPLPDNFADKLVLHNAYEHFEGTADSDFIREAWRVLKPGGVLCILPLFMSERFTVITDPLVDRRGVIWDPGVQIVEIPWWHTRFARLYDADRLRERVLEPGSRFQQRIYYMTNASEVHPRISLHFALMMRKHV